jgi:hypothetical protein
LVPINLEKLLANAVVAVNPVKTHTHTVPRKTKISENRNDAVGDPAAPPAAAEPKVAKRASRRTSTAPKRSKTLEKTSSPTTKASGRAGAETARPAAPTDEEIQLRAYFISERRHRFALPGDASSDWLEAKRQLLSESGRR